MEVLFFQMEILFFRRQNFSNSKEEYAFIYWLINNHGDWTAEFSKILEEFLNKETIKNTLEKINKILKPSK